MSNNYLCLTDISKLEIVRVEDAGDDILRKTIGKKEQGLMKKLKAKLDEIDKRKHDAELVKEKLLKLFSEINDRRVNVKDGSPITVTVNNENVNVYVGGTSIIISGVYRIDIALNDGDISVKEAKKLGLNNVVTKDFQVETIEDAIEQILVDILS